MLVSLLLLSVAGAFLSDRRMGLALNNILLGLTLVTSIYPVSQNKSFVWIGGVFAAAFVQ
ncbi:MAG: hypothetical protein VX929_12475 [Pseudomonadota bacterium]|nr:hypothetical protein [Pseudomonadota bacterium]